MTVTCRWFVTGLSIFAMWAVAPARADDPAETWAQAERAFATENYRQALSLFSALRSAGQGDAALLYNIAVSQYKLGRFAAARETFRELRRTYPDMTPLVEYNLGLVALRLGDERRAAGHFRQIGQLAGADAKLHALASAQLRRLGDDPADSGNWIRMISGQAGFDDNVILQDETGIAGVSADSPFVSAFGTLRGPYSHADGWRLDGGFFLLRYTDASDFNQAGGYLGGIYEWRDNAWTIEFSLHLAANALGGEAFDRSARLGTRATYEFSPASSLALRYRYDNVNAADRLVAGVEGKRQRIDLNYRWTDRDHFLDLQLATESNDRSDPSVSPDRIAVKVHYRYQWSDIWSAGSAIEFRASEYSDLEPVRDEDLSVLTFEISREMRQDWHLYAELALAENGSSDPEFSYSRNRISIGAYRVF